ncbi:molybdopterin biosynthesis protein MoeE [Methanomicrobiaceae archaeon CYW5]|uniref:molybdenum cofactor biosynthesis protein MoaE n=1 Tax=Methanovulcanius yangii TaxID=1789227 RepID=UPI0029CAA9F0|nr:molybdenum cofactor biosynthesis protein MoaE [Methanovulcanius yangii]MBT8508764.1 molybdopterin biosynthesis protein MoeE [Methanovulcanius yangii]
MIAIQEEDIDIAALIAASRRDSMGAQVVFVGTVRDDGIEAIEFEAHAEMATKDLEEIAAGATETFGLHSVDIIHRTGLLPVGETIVVIVVGAGHRAEGFEGCRWILERIKEFVPIWKKDIAGETARWHH